MGPNPPRRCPWICSKQCSNPIKYIETICQAPIRSVRGSSSSSNARAKGRRCSTELATFNLRGCSAPISHRNTQTRPRSKKQLPPQQPWERPQRSHCPPQKHIGVSFFAVLFAPLSSFSPPLFPFPPCLFPCHPPSRHRPFRRVLRASSIVPPSRSLLPLERRRAVHLPDRTQSDLYSVASSPSPPFYLAVPRLAALFLFFSFFSLLSPWQARSKMLSPAPLHLGASSNFSSAPELTLSR